MKALILTFGTRGDIDPFAALAQRLAEAGHDAVLAAPEAVASFRSPPGSRRWEPRWTRSSARAWPA